MDTNENFWCAWITRGRRVAICWNFAGDFFFRRAGLKMVDVRKGRDGKGLLFGKGAFLGFRLCCSSSPTMI